MLLLLGHLDKCWPMIPRSVSAGQLSCHSAPQPAALCGIVVIQVQHPALHFVEPHTTGLSPLIQPVKPS